MPPRVKPGTDEEILADWHTGDYSKLHGGTKTQRDLAYKHNVSKGKIGQLVKGVEPINYKIVGDLVSAKQLLAKQNGQNVGSVNEVVDERTKHIAYFASRHVENVEAAFTLPVENQNDCKARADTITKAQEGVLGKAPDTAININSSGKMQIISGDMSANDAARAYADFMASGRNG